MFPTHSEISLISECAKLKKVSFKKKKSLEKLKTNVRNTILWVPLIYSFMLVTRIIEENFHLTLY